MVERRIQHAVAVPKDGGVVDQVPQELARIGLASCPLKYYTVPQAHRSVI